MSKIDIHGRWVTVYERSPKNLGVKITMTKNKEFGIYIFNGSEWVSALPTPMGEVFYWYENYDASGNEIDFLWNRDYE